MRRALHVLVLCVFFASSFVAQGQSADCPTMTPLEFLPGMTGQVTPGSANRLRDLPSRSGNIITEIPGGDTFTVLDVPTCADGLRWWRVAYDDQQGWTAEGSDGEYFLELLPDQPAPAVAPVDNQRQIDQWGYGTALDTAWSPDGSRFIVASTSGIWLYDPSDWSVQPQLLVEAPTSINSIAFDPSSSTTLAVAYRGAPLQLIDISTGETQELYRAYSGFTQIQYSRDGSLLAAKSGRQVYIWENANRQLVQVFSTSDDDPAIRFALSPDGARLALGFDSGTVQVYDVRTRELIADQFPYSSELGLSTPYVLAFSPDSTHLLGGDYNGHLRLWSLDGSGYLEYERPYEGDPWTKTADDVAFLQDGRFLTAETNGGVELWSANGIISPDERITPEDVRTSRTLSLSPDETMVAAVTENPSARIRQVQIFRLDTGEVLAALPYFATIRSFALNPSGDTAAYMLGTTVQIVNAETGEPISAIDVGDRDLDQLVFSPDGQMLAFCANEGWFDWSPTIEVYQLDDLDAPNAHVDFYLPDDDWISCQNLQFSPDGTRLIFDSAHAILSWDFEDGLEPVFVPEAITVMDFLVTDAFTVVATGVSADSGPSILLYPQSDESAEPLTAITGLENFGAAPVYNHFVLDSATGRLAFIGGENALAVLLYTVEDDLVPSGMIISPSAVTTIAFSPDGTQIAVGDRDGLITLWDVESQEQIATTGQASGYITGLTFSADGTRLYSTASDYFIRVWSLEA